MKEFHKTEAQLPLSFIKPHKGVTTHTISRWILEILDLSGSNTKVFTGNSTRSASTSKTKTSGVSLNNILKKRH